MDTCLTVPWVKHVGHVEFNLKCFFDLIWNQLDAGRKNDLWQHGMVFFLYYKFYYYFYEITSFSRLNFNHLIIYFHLWKSFNSLVLVFEFIRLKFRYLIHELNWSYNWSLTNRQTINFFLLLLLLITNGQPSIKHRIRVWCIWWISNQI